MNVSLTPELEKFVQDKVKSGLYTTASEVIRESLRLMHTHDDVRKQQVSQLNQAIEIGLQQLSQGKKTPADKSYAQFKDKINKIARDKSK
jgi:antitoxin ParD1/3/4